MKKQTYGKEDYQNTPKEFFLHPLIGEHLGRCEYNIRSRGNRVQ
jgi:hypothetical protein